VICSSDRDGKGRIDQVLERRNWFIRPAVANIDALIFVASGVNPVTDPFLIDRVSVIAEESGCELIVCVNKTDLSPADELYAICEKAGFPLIRTSAATGEGVDGLFRMLHGKTSAFTGNSGVGKSSLLNCLLPGLRVETAEVSEKLGRGKHTTRHVELFRLDDSSFIADTPGFASFELEMMQTIAKENLADDFVDFHPYLGKCRFHDCAHLKEPGCAVTEAVQRGDIHPSRYRSYCRLYELCAQQNFWEIKNSR
jgi:ribosome biogenesis GTPase